MSSSSTTRALKPSSSQPEWSTPSSRQPERPPSHWAAASHPHGSETGAVRASDDERDAAAADLRVHAAAGRLDVDELDARLGAVLRARTRAEVASALDDLPPAGKASRGDVATGRPRPELHAYVSVMLLLLTIWLFTGAGHFWPLYPALGWGLPLLLGRCGARRPRATARP